MADSDYQIVVASADQVKWIIKMAENEQWNPGCNDAVTFQQADPTGFFIGLLHGQPIGCVSAVKYENYGHIGYYIVAKEHRGKGYGLKLFQHGMNYLKDYNSTGLDGVVDQQQNYMKCGFNSVHTNMRYVGVVPKSEIISDNIVEAKSISFEKLMEYDKSHWVGVRKHFMSSLINVGTNRSLVYLDTDKNIQGFGAIRKSCDGYRIGPLFAEKFEIAEELIHALTGSFEDCKVIIDVPIPNDNAIKLAKKLNMVGIFETARMYRGEVANVDLNTIYALTSLELG